MSTAVRIDHTVLIPTRDGEHLAATTILPAGDGPFPTLLSMTPYHKAGFTWAHHEAPSHYFAARGYATILVDLRGTGGSSGTAWDMMDPNEGRDVADAVDWTAAQEWCDGNIGMWGISYGALISLKAAAENPPALKAIAPIMGGLDLYHDYLYAGGCQDFSFAYGSYGNWMAAMHLMPPAVIDPSGRWYDVWMKRLKDNRPSMLAWQNHPDFDAYWKANAVSPEAVAVPTFMIGGWRDMFRDAVPSVYSALTCPKQLLIGPWMHHGPDVAQHKPVDYLGALARWFERWLKGIDDSGVEQPQVLVHVDGAEEWRSLPAWPPAPTANTTFYLASGGRLTDRIDGASSTVPYTVTPSVGFTAGHEWDPAEINVGAPSDQGLDDLRSLTFTTEPFTAPFAFAGHAVAHLRVTVLTGSDAQLVVRLTDVGPDGSSTLITRGRLNLRHRNSTASPEPIVTGETYDVSIALHAAAYSLPEGHRLRVAVAGADFPRVWPSAVNSSLQLHLGGDASSVVLPQVNTDDWPLTTPDLPNFMEYVVTSGVTGGPKYSVVRDQVTGSVAVNEGFWLRMGMPSGGNVSVDQTVVSRVADAYPEAAAVEAATTMQVELPGVGTAEVTAKSRASLPGTIIEARVTLNGVKIHEQIYTSEV